MDAVIRLSPDDDYAHITRGLAHFAKGNDDVAIADMDAVLQLDPDHAAAYMLRGILFGNRKQWNRMAADMTELIRLSPADARAYYQRGQAYGEQDLLDEAFADLCEAIRLDPDHADAHRVRGDCLRYQGEYDTAIADFDTALRLDPEPEELAFREQRLEKIREAMTALEAAAQAAAEEAEAAGKDHTGVPDDKAQRNCTDPESRIMPGPGGRDFLPAYNCQAVVDHEHQVIVAAQATNQGSDKQQAVAMIEEAIANLGRVPKEVSADAGYCSAQAVADLQDLGVDPYVAPEKTRHGHQPPPAPRGRIPKALSPRDRMRRKLQTKRDRKRYSLRMATVEPVFGQIKQGRGFRQFLLRGLEKVPGEWSLICTGHNLLKLFKFGNSVTNPRLTAVHTP